MHRSRSHLDLSCSGSWPRWASDGRSGIAAGALWDPRGGKSFTGEKYWVKKTCGKLHIRGENGTSPRSGRYRAFGETAPHPLAHHAVEQNAVSIPIATLAHAMQRGGRLPVRVARLRRRRATPR